MDATNAEEEQISCNDFDGILEPEKRLLQNYKKVLRLIQKDAFWNNIGEAFEKTYPGIKEYLKDHMKDLEKLDCGIVVAGETSSGKSTLINELIGHDALASGVLETTQKIYRVMHLESMNVKTYQSGCPEPIEHSFNSVEELHEMLENLEDDDTKDDTIYQVDVLLPFSKIQNENVTIVDTPGIGDSRKLKTIVEEYVPKAVAFVIIMDVTRAGGMQKDRLLPLLSTIKSCSSNMKCFELEDTLFVRNKWDCVAAGKKSRDKLKKKLTDRMKAEWPWVKDSQIFDICLRKTSQDDLSDYTLRFKQLEDAIHDLVKKKENIRIQTHGKYLSGVILEAGKVLSEALTAIQKQIDGSDIMFQNFTEHMTKTEEAIKKLQSTEEKIELLIIGKIVPSLHDYINSEEFSRLILQEEPKLETYLKMNIDGEIHSRIEKATKCWLYENVPQIVKTEFDILLRDITDRYQKMLSISQNFKGIAEIQFNSRLELKDVSWTVASGFAWISNTFFWSFFIGPQAVLAISTFLGLFTLSFGVAQIGKQFCKVKEIIQESFGKRVKSMDCEKLHDLLRKNLDNGLREFHRHIFTEVLPEAIKNMSYCVSLMKKDKEKMEEKQEKFKDLLTKFNGCQNDVANIMTSVSKS